MQRTMVAERIATMPRGANQHTKFLVCSQSEVAKQLNVSDESIRLARKVRTDGIPELIECDELRCELAEIDENLIRDDLEPAIRIKAIKRREQILESLGLRKKSGENQHTKRGVSEMDTPTSKVSEMDKIPAIMSTFARSNHPVKPDSSSFPCMSVGKHPIIAVLLI